MRAPLCRLAAGRTNHHSIQQAIENRFSKSFAAKLSWFAAPDEPMPGAHALGQSAMSISRKPGRMTRVRDAVQRLFANGRGTSGDHRRTITGG